MDPLPMLPVHLVGTLPVAVQLGETEHLCVHAARCRPRPEDYARVMVFAFVRGSPKIDMLSATLHETVGDIGCGWIDHIEPVRHPYAEELRSYLDWKFGPFLEHITVRPTCRLTLAWSGICRAWKKFCR